MNKKLLENVTMIVRSANERTEQLCKKLILDQGIQPENIFVIQEVPFSAAMRKAFNLGIENGLKWTYCIDADVLLRPNSVHKMLEIAEKQKDNVCEIQGLVMDKFFGGPRQAGNHLYRTSLLKKVIQNIPKEGTDIRPETYTLEKMEENGYPWLKFPTIVGLHDHEQFFYDIYRKCYTQGVKHVNRLELFVTLWREKRKDDKDFDIALHALSDSISNSKDVFINSELNIYKDGFEKLAIEEKKELDLREYDLKRIEQIIEDWNQPEIYYRYFPYAGGMISEFELQKKKMIGGFKKYSFFTFLKKSFQYIFFVR